MTALAGRAEKLLHTSVVATAPVAGGDVCVAGRLRLADGSSAFIKTRPHAPAGFFAAEAAGLRWLAEAPGGAPVPAVLGVAEDCLLLRWIEPGRPSVESAEEFGRRLAATHRSGSDRFGAEADGFLGTLPLPNAPAATWPEFYAARRVLPYLRTAYDRRAIEPDDAAAVETVLSRLADLAGPAEPPARIHGDLWSGNLLWGADGAAWLVDPAAHGGHRETDLAMLALFGTPLLPRIIEAYDAAFPLAAGWPARVPLHQLHPLLVHATSHGGGYGARAGDAARAALAAP
jgi:fructosamine-3-kinase